LLLEVFIAHILCVLSHHVFLHGLLLSSKCIELNQLCFLIVSFIFIGLHKIAVVRDVAGQAYHKVTMDEAVITFEVTTAMTKDMKEKIF
jgi:hypothetical protein